MTKFITGQTYYARSNFDYDCIFSFAILARTNKTVTIKAQGYTVRRGLKEYQGIESFMPFGSYSMAPRVHADQIAA